MSQHFDALWAGATGGAGRVGERARKLAYGALACPGRTTLTGMLTGSGQQFLDWTASYRLFSRQRFNPQLLLDGALQEVAQHTPAHQPLVAHIDDTLLAKTGRKIPGAGWRRDPLGPPFHTNFIWGQRFLQVSMALPAADGSGAARAIPVGLHHSPTASKPARTASSQAWADYRAARKACRISQVGAEQLAVLRERLDDQGHSQRPLIVSVDGSYTNQTVFRQLPERTTLIGRVRKDAKLYRIPEAGHPARGRRRVYGQRLPTPEQIRQSPAYPWQSISGYAAGRRHDFEVKCLAGLRWKSAGGKVDLQLMVIRPLGYRLSSKSRLLYRKPAYLICSDPDLSPAQLLQAYLWRWEIEVNFREQKTLIGVGQAQLWHPHSVEALPQFLTGTYSLLTLAGQRLARQQGQQDIGLPRPKWYPQQPGKRLTTGDLLNRWRAEQWAQAHRVNFDGFAGQLQQARTHQKTENPALSAMMYMRN